MIIIIGFSIMIAAGFSLAVRRLALAWQIVDRPELAPQRKHNGQRVPLLGGLAIWLTVLLMTAILFPVLTTGYLLPKHLFGIWLAGTILMIGGGCDDRWQLAPWQQLISPILATFVVVASGIGVNYISNPFGGTIHLQQYQWFIVSIQGLPYYLTLWADVFTVIWLMLSMYTTKLLDGLDGLVAGIGAIGGLIIGLLSFSAVVMQPETGTLAFIFAGACVGFLLWNFSPARLYLGEGGALYVGFMLGLLAIVSGSKIATALLILGLPILDSLAVVVRRIVVEHKSPLTGDLLHLHFQLQQRGWGRRAIVMVYYLLTLAFGLSTLLFTGATKLAMLALLSLCGLALVFYASLNRTSHRQ